MAELYELTITEVAELLRELPAPSRPLRKAWINGRAEGAYIATPAIAASGATFLTTPFRRRKKLIQRAASGQRPGDGGEAVP